MSEQDMTTINLSTATDAELNCLVAEHVMGWKDTSKGRPDMVGGFWDAKASRTRLIPGSPLSLQRVKLLKRPESEENADFVFDPLRNANDRDAMLNQFDEWLLNPQKRSNVSAYCKNQKGPSGTAVHADIGKAACIAALRAVNGDERRGEDQP